MDIKVITRHTPANYGSLLQSIATIKVFEELGHTCKIIDYKKPNEFGIRGCISSLYNKKKWNSNIILKFIYILLRYPEEKYAQTAFRAMQKKYLKLTDKCFSTNDLKKINADIFVTGSDQVWGPLLDGNYDNAYFLSFTNEKKIAYASSFGKSVFSDEIINAYKILLSNYSKISVREDSAVDLLNKWQIPCIGQVLDPTLMLTNEEWTKLIKKEKSQKYVLVYQIHNDKRLGAYAKKFAQYTNLPLIRISPSLHQISREGKLIYLPNIGEFLSYIKGATYFITDSFHGTAFAINFNIQFFEILPNTSTGTRNQSILKLTSLEDRIIRDYNDFSIIEKKIDYSSVNKILNKERMKSLSILKLMLSE